jgi:hypothetical protein
VGVRALGRCVASSREAAQCYNFYRRVFMRYVYADTSIWNRLCDQNVDPRAFSSHLANRRVVLAVGFNVFYEIAKLFFVGTNEATERGRELLNYMKQYLDLQIPMVKENGPLLIEEAMHVTGHKRMESCFRDSSQYQTAVREIEKLYVGDIGPEVKQFFERRKSAARTSRTVVKERLADRPDLEATFRKIPDEALSGFLKDACLAPLGQSLLLGHLRTEFPKNSPNDLSGVAKQLLQSPNCRVSRAMTRADLYLIWRCSKRGSLRGDLPDDTFHVVNAAYSDVFLTTEGDQADIARHAIEGSKALVFGQGEMISDRLLTDLGGIA